MSCRSSLVEFLGSLMYTIISSMKSDILISSFPICIPLMFFCFLTALAIFWVYFEACHLGSLVLFLILVGLLQFSLHLIWYCPLFCCTILLLCSDMDIEFLISLIILKWRGAVFWQMFSSIKWDDHVFFSLNLFMWWIMLMEFLILYHLCVPGMKPTWS